MKYRLKIILHIRTLVLLFSLLNIASLKLLEAEGNRMSQLKPPQAKPSNLLSNALENEINPKRRKL
jgi:hypothetical protein